MTVHNVYRLYNDQGELLYVGCTSLGAHRWVEHAGVQPWWADVSTVRVEHYPTRDDALLAEKTWIRNGNPKHNTMRYDGKPHGRGIYRRHHEGSIYLVRRRNDWCASIRFEGKRYYCWAGKDKAKAERWLAEFRREHGLDVSAA
jgi:hypothetical protein